MIWFVVLGYALLCVLCLAALSGILAVDHGGTRSRARPHADPPELAPDLVVDEHR